MLSPLECLTGEIQIDHSSRIISNKEMNKIITIRQKSLNIFNFFYSKIFRESIRCLPSPGFLIRKTVAKYTIPGTDVTLDEDMPVIISTEALSSDKQYFEDPELFKPERFHPDNIQNIKSYTFLPFGDGPRACIGK